MIKIAVVGYGNVGKAACEAVRAAGDMELVCLVTSQTVDEGLPLYKNVDEMLASDTKVDVAVLALPTRMLEDSATRLLEAGINTVDSFDIHHQILDHCKKLDLPAKSGKAVAIVSAGWDPGSDSIVRALLLAMIPSGQTYTNFGPGMSMGHTVAAKAVEGVKDAVSMTLPAGKGVHKRLIYLELEEGYVFDEVTARIKQDAYFAGSELEFKQIDRASEMKNVEHGVKIERQGKSGSTQGQLAEFSMRINNPALTGQMMVSAARATMKQAAGAYTVIDIPPVDFLEGDRENLIASLV